MRIAVTGASSSVGRSVCDAARVAGLEVARLVRRPTQPGDVFFDLSQPPQPSALDGVSALVHIAWNWTASGRNYRRVNVDGGRRLLALCESKSARVVLLSTFSTYSKHSSMYASAKRALEEDIRSLQGSTVRAGLLWGSEMAGMTQTVTKLARTRGVCPHLIPDPVVYQSHQATIAQVLVDECASMTMGRVILGAHARPLPLSQLVHAARGSSHGIHVGIPVAPLRAGLRFLENVGVSLRVRSDSLGGALTNADVPATHWEDAFSSRFPVNGDFLSWLSSQSQTGNDKGRG